MTRDLAGLIGPDETWMNTQAFLGKIDENLQVAMTSSGADVRHRATDGGGMSEVDATG